jgi:hypothetical protein
MNKTTLSEMYSELKMNPDVKTVEIRNETGANKIVTLMNNGARGEFWFFPPSNKLYHSQIRARTNEDTENWFKQYLALDNIVPEGKTYKLKGTQVYFDKLRDDFGNLWIYWETMFSF